MSFRTTITDNDVTLIYQNKSSVNPKRFIKKSRRPYGDRNFKTFTISALDWLGANRIFARLADENEKKLGVDIVVRLRTGQTLIKLSPINAPIDIIKFRSKQPSVIVVNSLEELVIYFGKKLSS